MKKVFLILQSIFLIIIFGCGSSKDQRELANTALAKLEECKNIGGVLFESKGKCLIWDLSTNSLHSANKLLPDSLRYHSGIDNVTIFLVCEGISEKVGTYSISRESAIRQWIEIYIVQAPEMKPIGFHEIVSLNPRESRQVKYSPEYGNKDIPLVKFVNCFHDLSDNDLKTLPSGLQYEIIKNGTGEKPTVNDHVRCNIKLITIEGKIFGNSNDLFEVKNINSNYEEAFQFMRTGSYWRLFIRPDSDDERDIRDGDIGLTLNSTFIVEIELLETLDYNNFYFGLKKH